MNPFVSRVCVVVLAGYGLLGGACQSVEAPKPEPVTLGAIPEDYGTLWKAWLLRDPRFHEMRDQSEGDPKRMAFLVENLVSVLLGELTAGRIDSGSEAKQTTYERARRELVLLGPHSASALAEVLALGQGMGPVAVGDLLVEIGSPSVEPLLGQLAREDSDLARRRAAKALATVADDGIPMGAPDADVREALGQHLANDPDWIVRSQCALALAPWGRFSVSTMAQSSRYLVPALKDTDSSVKTDVVHGLARLGDPRTFPAIINHLERSEQTGDVSQTMLAQAALTAMTRNKGAKKPSEWRAWWRDARPRVIKRFLQDYADPLVAPSGPEKLQR